MSDIEGAICDVCGTTVGPHGCCSTRRGLFDVNEKLISQLAERDKEIERLRETIVRCAIPLEALKIVPDGLGDKVRTAIDDAVDAIRAVLNGWKRTL